MIDFTFDKLQKAFYDLLDELKKLGMKNGEPKKINQGLANEKEEMLKEKMQLIEEN